MKQNIIKLIAIVILLNSFKSVSIEDRYENCVYKSLLNNGGQHKRFITVFEDPLIRSMILENSSASSYLSLYKPIANKTSYPTNYSYSYIDSINSIERYKIIPVNKDCYKSVSSRKTLQHFNNG
jgi:hypothetical protein